MMSLETAKTPTMLANELHTSIANISRALHQLQSKGLAECITPKARVGRIYVATRKGREASKKVKEMGDQITTRKMGS